jgi:hypothetical protein
MVKEKIEEVSTEILLKRKRFILVLAGILIGASLIMIGLIIYDLINDKEVKSTLTGLFPALACFWIPLMMLGRVNAELKRKNGK